MCASCVTVWGLCRASLLLHCSSVDDQLICSYLIWSYTVTNVYKNYIILFYFVYLFILFCLFCLLSFYWNQLTFKWSASALAGKCITIHASVFCCLSGMWEGMCSGWCGFHTKCINNKSSSQICSA